MFDPPGFCDDLSEELLDAWNNQIKETYYEVRNNFQQRQHNFGRFFRLNPTVSEQNRVKKIIEWGAHPRFIESCLGSNRAHLFCDSYSNDARYQAEYCEYRIIDRKDPDGRFRPKRVQITTELRDYWTCIAQRDPEKLKEMVRETIHMETDWNLLYGADPYKLNEIERKEAFQIHVAGLGEQLDRWIKPLSVGINEQNALCMINPFNGLYDLLYSLMFGAVPYIINKPDLQKKKHKIENVKQIFLGVKDRIQDPGKNFRICAHADTSIVKRVYEQALYGRKMSLSNPVGLYIFSFNSDLFFLKDNPIPKRWMRWSRGQVYCHG